MWLVSALVACTAPTPDRILAYSWQGDGTHIIEPVPMGVIEDPVRMRTRLGDGQRGGYITASGLLGDEATVEVRDGSPVHVRHVIDDDVFVPQDEQGLIFASFYHHLAGVRREFVDLGFEEPLDRLFPVDGVYFGFSILTEFLSFENAAFLSEGTTEGFVLFPDGNRGVPLGGHIAVVRHEFSHGLLDSALPIFDSGRLEEALELVTQFELRAVDEGFADLVAVLTLDDPGALPLEGRDPSVRLTLDDVDLTDFYSLGTVIASFVWRIRERIDDPERTLLLAFEALERWDAEAWERGETSAVRYADIFASFVIAAYPDERLFVCEQFAGRFQQQGSECPFF